MQKCIPRTRLYGDLVGSLYSPPHIVAAPLTAHIQPQSQVVDVGKQAQFQCIPGGSPVARVAWYRDGRPLASDGRLQVLTGPERLVVSPLTKEDHGMYQCFVSNDWDMAQATAELHLGGRRTFVNCSFNFSNKNSHGE